MSEALTPPAFTPLAILPNGESVRPERVLGITIEPTVTLYDCEVERFDVVARMVDGSSRTVGERLLRAAAQTLATEAALAINRASRRPSA